MKIGVFDSGIGGKSVADRLKLDYPFAEVLYVDDRNNVPYGNRAQKEIIALTDAAIQPLIESCCDVIVLACNTATAAAIEFLRSKYPHVPFIGLEPMVKTAANLTESGIVAICATPYTLKSQRYIQLKNQYVANVNFIEPDCSEWASMIEHDQIDNDRIGLLVEAVCNQGADVIVLACTHYHWIKQKIIDRSGARAVVIDPSEAISKRVGVLLADR